ncbi:IclR family transcriptional regulator [Sphingomonas solaris]|uniref:Helix-turn-helix domain-containing protein n=1 Tax=Alterirhizorhabdus solaris TaxID=2529389 RepID=A0A558RBH6_9SPHN|nr:helix-turn-helix domain-containing protein [Sphingomonas solaris]TVV76711.1 helix-turn-helix domain-containing protein [Sphingomonas solaris]
MPERTGITAPSRPVRVTRPDQRRSLSRSATRALDVLEVFGRERRPLRAIDVSRALDLHPSTTNQLLKTMVGSAHLTFEAGTRTYLPSPRLARFGAWMMEVFGGDEALRLLVRDMQAATGETVTLTTPNDLSMQIVDFIDATCAPAAERAERGLCVSIFGSAIGAAYLSTLPDAEVRGLARRARIADREIEAVMDAVPYIRRAGVADAGTLGGTIWSVAAPLAQARFPAPLVLGLAGPADRIRPRLDTLRAAIREAAARLP